MKPFTDITSHKLVVCIEGGEGVQGHSQIIHRAGPFTDTNW